MALAARAEQVLYTGLDGLSDFRKLLEQLCQEGTQPRGDEGKACVMGCRGRWCGALRRKSVVAHDVFNFGGGQQCLNFPAVSN